MIDSIDIQLYSFFIIFGGLILFIIIATINGEIVKFKERKEQKVINDKWTKIFVDLSKHPIPIEEKKKVSETKEPEEVTKKPSETGGKPEGYDVVP
tara:strand:- start:25 stop:312 length:288 start_codon:yes stop_codon:yes gene_type:complete